MYAIAHRGYSSRYPENTHLAFEQAILAIADFVETDLRLSRDGVIVCSHDPDLVRLLGRKERIENLDVAALMAADTGDGKGIPIFEDVLDRAAGRSGLFLDVKITTDAMMALILEVLSRHPSSRNIVFGARRLEQLEWLRRQDIEFAAIGMIRSFEEIPRYLALGVRGIRIWEEDLTEAPVQMIHDAGREVWVTAGLRSREEVTGTIDRQRLRRLMKLGIDGVLVNDPVMVIQERARK